MCTKTGTDLSYQVIFDIQAKLGSRRNSCKIWKSSKILIIQTNCFLILTGISQNSSGNEANNDITSSWQLESSLIWASRQIILHSATAAAPDADKQLGGTGSKTTEIITGLQIAVIFEGRDNCLHYFCVHFIDDFTS